MLHRSDDTVKRGGLPLRKRRPVPHPGERGKRPGSDRADASHPKPKTTAHDITGLPAPPARPYLPAAEPTAGQPMDDPILKITGVTKRYDSGFEALRGVDLEIARGEIFALLGPNGAGKTTLIGIICGIVRASGGTVIADGHDIAAEYRAARAKIGLVPQELATDMFETVWSTVTFSRGLFGKPPNRAFVEQILRDLSLWEKRHEKISALSGGMKRRVLIAKALSHEPTILFLDEPTAGVDVELRRDMWAMVRKLRESGVTIILTTHYIEEAEEMADRVGVINRGRIVLVQEKTALMKTLGKTTLTLELAEPLDSLPEALALPGVELADGGHRLNYTADGAAEHASIPDLLRRIDRQGIEFKGIETRRSTLEDIFVDLVRERS